MNYLSFLKRNLLHMMYILNWRNMLHMKMGSLHMKFHWRKYH